MKSTIKLLTALLACAALTLTTAIGLEPFPGRILSNAGAPSNGTTEVQTITWSAFAAGTITFTYKGATATVTATGAESNAALDTAVDAALEGMGTIGTGGVTVVTSGTTNRAFAITFAGNHVKLAVDAIDASVTAGTVAVVETTPGVTATGRSQSPAGQLLIDATNAKLYINTGTTLSPTWIVVGTQT